MTQEELDKIVEQHRHWLKKDCEGWEHMKADLSEADLSGADLCRANLYGANLRDAILCRANLYGANLCEVILCRANLYGANLRDANLCRANLYGVNLYGADLRGARLYGANLNGANLCCADLDGANLRSANLSCVNLCGAHLNGIDLYGANFSCANLSGADLTGTGLYGAYKFRLGKILDEQITGYKKTKEGVIITAEIPAGAIVFCINGIKCRTNRAKITDMGGHEVLHSQHDKFFEYRLGQEIEIKDFDLMYNVECTSGFHFLRTRKEAEEYK
jgi:uncharacterized protein YjbI with pentapeptide repeats